MMLGKKHFVFVKQCKERVHVQKRFVLCKMKEVYQLFKEKFPNETIGSKFADLHPVCVLPGASGIHLVCVCSIHQNVKLTILSAKLPDLCSILMGPSKSSIFSTYPYQEPEY